MLWRTDLGKRISIEFKENDLHAKQILEVLIKGVNIKDKNMLAITLFIYINPR